jgi:hypothetical protein
MARLSFLEKKGQLDAADSGNVTLRHLTAERHFGKNSAEFSFIILGPCSPPPPVPAATAKSAFCEAKLACLSSFCDRSDVYPPLLQSNSC